MARLEETTQRTYEDARRAGRNVGDDVRRAGDRIGEDVRRAGDRVGVGEHRRAGLGWLPWLLGAVVLGFLLLSLFRGMGGATNQPANPGTRPAPTAPANPNSANPVTPNTPAPNR